MHYPPTWLQRNAALCGFLLLVAVVLSAGSWLASRPLRPTAGLAQTVYGTPDFQNPPIFRQRTSELEVSSLADDRNLRQRARSVRWEGYWLVEPGGPLDLSADADGPVRIWIDERLVVERSPARDDSTTSERLRLERGPHRLRIEYVHDDGDAHLEVQWAPAEQRLQPLPSRSLFLESPSGALIRRARLLGRLDAVGRVTWVLAGAASILLLVAPLAVQGLWWMRRGLWLRRVVSHTTRQGVVLARRHSRAACMITSAFLVVWTAYARWGGLNPRTLWKDDVWVAALTRMESMWTAMAVPAPAPPGFIGLLWLTTRVIHAPDLALQVVPFVSGLVGPLLLGLVVARVTASQALGLAATALGLVSPPLAYYSIYVKQYSLDYCVTAAFLLLAVVMLHDRRDRMKTAVLCGVGSAFCSLPSIFSSVALVHLTALRESLDAFRRRAPRWRHLCWTLAFDLVLAVMFFALLRGRSGPALRQFWSRDFLPVTAFDPAIVFLRTHGTSAVVAALPASLAWAAPFAALGMAWLLLSREWRWLGAMVLLIFVGVLAASGLQLYPIGQGFNGRTVIFSYAPTIMLVVVGISSVTRWLPFPSLPNTAIAIAATVLAFRAPAPATYVDVDHADFVRQLEAVAQPADVVVLSAAAAYLAGAYLQWGPMPVLNDSTQGFGVDFERPHTFALGPHEGDEADHPALVAFLARERPRHLWFFSTRDDTLSIETLVAAHGCVEQGRRSSTVSTLLLEYSCIR